MSTEKIKSTIVVRINVSNGSSMIKIDKEDFVPTLFLMCQICQDVKKIWEVDISLFFQDISDDIKKLSLVNQEYICYLLAGFEAEGIAREKYEAYLYNKYARQSISSKATLETIVTEEIRKKTNNIKSHISRSIKPVISEFIDFQNPDFLCKNKVFWVQVLTYLKLNYPLTLKQKDKNIQEFTLESPEKMKLIKLFKLLEELKKHYEIDFVDLQEIEINNNEEFNDGNE
ncbi:hypothetical protein cce_4801 [Crocosphaera subtropica ATCC 51142]|uniref:Uncharacterized protein n=1 Tax=Crocosphaera subtropica (strain ATCC 51142 / BH68) TaxID=43989 RepID=B1X1Y8_CROS5|nr:hypothetical protein [Crocosphaera subtropica]ACB54149.1 hypothetical protein cce_4801 [Crocosphaera subtropica ATCC 51142]